MTDANAHNARRKKGLLVSCFDWIICVCSMDTSSSCCLFSLYLHGHQENVPFMGDEGVLHRFVTKLLILQHSQHDVGVV